MRKTLLLALKLEGPHDKERERPSGTQGCTLLVASKELGTVGLQLKEMNPAKTPRAWKRTASSRRVHSPANTSVLAVGDPGQRTQPVCAQTSDPQGYELINGCGFQLLRLW